MWVKRMTEKKVVLRNKRYADTHEETEKAFSFVIKTKSKANSRIKTKLYASILTHTFLDWYATIFSRGRWWQQLLWNSLTETFLQMVFHFFLVSCVSRGRITLIWLMIVWYFKLIPHKKNQSPKQSQGNVKLWQKQGKTRRVKNVMYSSDSTSFMNWELFVRKSQEKVCPEVTVEEEGRLQISMSFQPETKVILRGMKEEFQSKEEVSFLSSQISF